MHIIFIIPESILVGGFCSHNNQCTKVIMLNHAKIQNADVQMDTYIMIDFECKRAMFVTVHIRKFVFSFLTSFITLNDFSWERFT